MASLNSIFDSVGRATSTPRVNVNPSQGARSKLLCPMLNLSDSQDGVEELNLQLSTHLEPVSRHILLFLCLMYIVCFYIFLYYSLNNYRVD